MAAVARPNVPPATGSYAQRYAGATVLTFTNHGHQPICEVDISPASDREFGDNWLAAGEQIMPEASRTFAIQGGGRWDIRAYDCRHRMVVAGPTLRLGDLNPSVSLSANGRGGGGALIALGLAEEIGGTLAWDLGSENGIRYGLGATLWICGALSLGVGIAVLASPGSRLELDHDGSQRRYRARTGVQFAGFDAAPVPGGGLVSAVRFQF